MNLWLDCWRPDDRRVHTWPHPPATERRLVMVNRSIIKNLALEPFKSLMLQVLNDCTHASSNRNSRSVALHACFGWIASETLETRREPRRIQKILEVQLGLSFGKYIYYFFLHATHPRCFTEPRLSKSHHWYGRSCCVQNHDLHHLTCCTHSCCCSICLNKKHRRGGYTLHEQRRAITIIIQEETYRNH